LNVSLNEISFKGAVNLGCALSSNSSLSKLHIHNNNIGKEGAEAIVVTLMNRQHFMVLNVSRNSIPDWFISKIFTLNVPMIDAGYQFETKFKEVHKVRRGLVEKSFFPVDEKMAVKKRGRMNLPVYLKGSSPSSTELHRIRDQLNKDLTLVQASVMHQKQALQKATEEYNNKLLAKALEDYTSTENTEITSSLLDQAKKLELQLQKNEDTAKELERIIQLSTEENGSILSTCEMGRVVISRIVQLYEGSSLEPSLDMIMGYLK